jgi:hypothetical protein
MVLGAIATGYGLWNAFRRNTKLGAGISNKVGNWIQEKMKVKDNDSGFTKLLKGAGDALNKEVFDPDNVTSEDKAPSYQQVSNNSSNSTWYGGEGAVYGSSPIKKQNYDYVRTDFENLLRKNLPPEIGRSHKFDRANAIAKAANRPKQIQKSAFRRFFGY